MAISRYNLTKTTSGGSANPRTFSFDVGSGSDRLLLVFGLYYNASGTDILSGVTYGGVAMTKVNAVDNITNAFYTSMWYLINPTSGSNNISASFSATPIHSWFVAVAHDGCLQSAQPDTSGGSSSTASTYTASTTTTVDGDFMYLYNAGNRTTTANTNATALTSVDGSGDLYEHTSNPLSPAGAKTMVLNLVSPTAHNGFHWITIKPAAAAAPAFVPRVTIY